MNNRFVILLLGIIFFLSSFAQNIDEKFKESFTKSFPIREQQHLEMKAYIDKLLHEKIEESLNFFKPDFFTINDYENSLYPYREALSNQIGYPPLKSLKGEIVKFEKVGEDRYSSVHRVFVQVAEGITTYGIYMVPKNINKKAPLIIALHGGGGNPEAICGLDTRVNYHNFGYEAVKRGYIVWAPGLIMLSNYSEDPISVQDGNRDLYDKQLKLINKNIIGLEIHKIIESTRVLTEERSEIDIDNIGMTGLSLGGFYTMYTTALCPFIKAAAPSGLFIDRKAELLNEISVTGMNRSRNALKGGFGNFQAIGLICPRPCMVQLGENDGLFSMEGARLEAERAAYFYQKLEIGDRFEFNTHDGGHEYEIESIFNFFDKLLK